MQVVAVIADIVSSRLIGERDMFQHNLGLILEGINQDSVGLISPYTITLGDEFQALYSNPRSLFKDIFSIMLALYPVKLRFAVGFGELSTDVNINKAIGMDGPVFHVARSGLDILKKSDFNIIQVYQENNIFIIENQSLLLICRLINSWKQNTFTIFSGLINDLPIRDIAVNAGISERGVYKIIKTNNLKEIVNLWQTIEENLIKCEKI